MSHNIQNFTLNDFERNQFTINYKIGFFGGRKFILSPSNTNRKLHCSINELYLRLSELSLNATDIECEKIERIFTWIKKKDSEATQLLERSNAFKRFLTKIRSWIGTFLINRQVVTDKINSTLKSYQDDLASAKVKRQSELKQKMERPLLSLLEEFVNQPTIDLLKTESIPEFMQNAPKIVLLDTKILKSFNNQEIIQALESPIPSVRAYVRKCLYLKLKQPLNTLIHLFASDKYQWSSEALKKERLAEFAKLWVEQMIQSHEKPILALPIDNHEIPIHHYTLNSQLIFGSNNKNEPKPTHPFLAEGIAEALKHLGAHVSDQITHHLENATLTNTTPLGFQITFTQSPECSLTKNMLENVLDALKEIPALLKIEAGPLNQKLPYCKNIKEMIELNRSTALCYLPQA